MKERLTFKIHNWTLKIYKNRGASFKIYIFFPNIIKS